MKQNILIATTFLIGLSTSWSSSLAAGTLSSGATDPDGFLWTWGKGGGLGFNDQIDRTIPTKLNTKFKHIVLGAGIGGGIDSTGRLFLWGSNHIGQLGQGDVQTHLGPVQVAGVWSKLWISDSSVLALDTAGYLWSWGDNSEAKLGLGDYAPRSSPVKIGAQKWLKAHLGPRNGIAIKADSTLWTWGDNANGQQGRGDTTVRLSPSQMGSEKWQSVAVGEDFAVAIRKDSTLWAWGANDLGQLGDGTKISSWSPKQIGANRWLEVATGLKHAAALSPTGSLWTWGDNAFGQLGQNANSNTVPTEVPVLMVKEFVLGSNHTLIKTNQGTLWAWGWNAFGQIGDSSQQNAFAPIGVGFKRQEILASPLTQSVYGALPKQLNVNSTQGLTVAIESMNSNCAIRVGDAVQPLHAGTCLLKYSQLGDAWTAAAPTKLDSFEVQPKSLVIQAMGAQKTYGDTDRVWDFQVQGLVNGDLKTDLLGKLERQNGEDIGAYAFTLGSLNHPDYSMTFSTDSLKILPKILRVQANRQSKTYGSVDPSLTWSASGFVTGEGVEKVQGELSREPGEAVGSYAIQVGTLEAANYSIDYVLDSLITLPKALVVTAAKQKWTYGDQEPSLTWSATGYIASEGPEIAQGGLSRQIGNAVGTYAIQKGSLSFANYSPVWNLDSAVILPRVLTVKADSLTKELGEIDPVWTWSAEGFAPGENSGLVQGMAVRDTGEKVGSYAIRQGSLFAPNYSINFQTASLSILKKSQQISFDSLKASELNQSRLVLRAVASSGLPLSISVGDSSVCIWEGVYLRMIKAGTCKVTVGQAGDAIYAPAQSVTRELIWDGTSALYNSTGSWRSTGAFKINGSRMDPAELASSVYYDSGRRNLKVDVE